MRKLFTLGLLALTTTAFAGPNTCKIEVKGSICEELACKVPLYTQTLDVKIFSAGLEQCYTEAQVVLDEYKERNDSKNIVSKVLFTHTDSNPETVIKGELE